MKIVPSVDSLESLPSLRGHIVRSGLLLFVAGLLLLWLSGGIPPAPWFLLILTIVQFGAPWGQQGSIILWPYILLIVQSLALGAAWTLFVWAIIHETRYILNIRARLQQTVPITVSKGIGQSDTSSSPVFTPVQRLDTSQRDEQDLLPEPRQKGKFPENPFEEAGMDQSDYPVGQNPGNSPFDVQGDVYSVFRRPHPYSTILAISEEKEEEEEEKEEESPFRYGNPFEGSLPEVFNYDVDLRRSIMELETEVTQLEIDPSQKNQLKARKDKKSPFARP